MARASLSDDLKKALTGLSSKEKDKLIFRLLPRDQKLVHQLEYKLLELSATQEERRDEVAESVAEKFSIYPSVYYSPAYLMKDLKKMSSIITYHVAVTADKFGEIELTLLLLLQGLSPNIELLQKEDKWAIEKLAIYVAKKIQKLSTLIPKLHEDLHLEFEDDLVQLRALFQKLPLLSEIANQHDIILDILDN